MQIDDIMSKDIVVCTINNSIYDVSKKMLENDIGFMPIVSDKKVVGVVTDRDIVANAISNVSNTNKDIKNYITKKIVYLDKDNSIDTCLDLMGREKVKRVIITDNNKMVGIVSLSDIINHRCNETLFLKTLKAIYPINKNIDYNNTEIDEFYL